MAQKPTAWTPKQLALLRAKYPHSDTRALAAQLGKSRTAVYSRAEKLGLKKLTSYVADTVARTTRARSRWTPALEEVMALLYPHCSTKYLQDLLGLPRATIASKALHMGLRKTKATLAEQQHERIRNNPQAYERARFQPGHATWNKGLKGLHIGGLQTRFKPGNVPHTHLPVGTQHWRTVSGKSTLLLKVAEPDQWRPVHHMVWEKAHGQSIPPGHVVQFVDGDRANVAPHNLRLASRAEVAMANSPFCDDSLPPAVLRLIRLRGSLTRAINNTTRRHAKAQDHNDQHTP